MNLPDPELWKKKLSPLLDELLDLDAPGQQRRLEELRSTDASLGDQLASLLNSARLAEAAHFLNRDAQAHFAETPSLVGQQIGAYVIESLLGQGGSGSVWRARRADGRFEGSVAVKLLHLSLLARTGALRFEREGAILARLAHRNIARLLDAGVTAQGQPYLVIELIEGLRIDRYCDAQRLNVAQRLALFAQVLAAVAHAHSHLVIHRDIKPNNILVAADGSVKLLDFGIAKLLQDEPAAAAPVTREAQLVMTPDYAAPEQLQGGSVTTATDVYALGVLLYQLLVGRHPTAGGATTPAEAMQATLHTKPLRLVAALNARASADTAAPELTAQVRATLLPQLRRQLQGDLDNIVAQALRKEASQRYQTVAALAEDLRRCLAHEPVSARPDSLAYRSAKFIRRNRPAVAAGLLLAFALAAGVVGTVTQARRAERERDNALQQLAYAKSSTELISFLLEEGSNKPFTTVELLARAEPVLQKQFADDPAQRAHLLFVLADLYANANYRKKADALLLRAQLDAQTSADGKLKAQIDCQIARQHGYNGRFDLAGPMFELAIASLRAAPGGQIDPAALARCLYNRSEVADTQGHSAAALTDAKAALEVLATSKLNQRAESIYMRAMLARALGKVGDAAAAAREYQRAIADLEALGRGSTTTAIAFNNNLGVLLAGAGQPLAASQAYAQAFQIARGLGGAPPPLEANYANRLIELGQPREAMPLIEHALGEARARADRRIVGNILMLGSRAWCVTNELARCEEMLLAASTELTSQFPPGHSVLGALQTHQALLALARGNPAQGRAELERAVAIFDAAKEMSPNAIRTLAWLARSEIALGEFDAAQTHAARAVLQARQAMAGFAHSAWLGEALVAQGLVQRARGDGAAAQASGRAALLELQGSGGETAPVAIEAQSLLAGT